jgi:hypothetical protein
MADADYLEILDWLARNTVAGKRGSTQPKRHRFSNDWESTGLPERVGFTAPTPTRNSYTNSKPGMVPVLEPKAFTSAPNRRKN